MNISDNEEDYEEENTPRCMDILNKKQDEVPMYCPGCGLRSQKSYLINNLFMGLCSSCVPRSVCSSCNELKINTWEHGCGIFCRDCVQEISIDVSPMTLGRLFDKQSDACYIGVAVELMKCERCMGNKTVLECQFEYYSTEEWWR